MLAGKCDYCSRRNEVNLYPLYEYDNKEMCSDCVSVLAKTKKDYKAERHIAELEDQKYDNCCLCGKLYAYLIDGEFGERFCIKCIGTQELPRGETYRLALWSRYLDKQAKIHDDFYDTKRFK